MIKLILMPFVAIFVILRTVFFPWYIKWFFRLNWTIYIAIAGVVGYFAYTAYEDYRFNVLEAGLRTQEAAPRSALLSQFSERDIGAYDEVLVEGLYFSALPQGEFENSGSTRGYIMLADDRGQEVKAALVLRTGDLARLQRQLAAQGDGDAIAVTVGGTLIRNTGWEDTIRNQMLLRGLPAGDELVVIEPFLGSRAAALIADAEQSFEVVIVLGVLAGVMAALGLGQFGLGMGDGRRSSATQSQMSARDVLAQRQAKAPSQKTVPSSSVSPWDSFDPQDSNIAPPSNSSIQKARAPAGRKAVSGKPVPTRSSKPAVTGVLPPEPAYKSVFPGGGSAFRFKTADEIIRQSFGTLSTLNKVNRNDE